MERHRHYENKMKTILKRKKERKYLLAALDKADESLTYECLLNGELNTGSNDGANREMRKSEVV